MNFCTIHPIWMKSGLKVKNISLLIINMITDWHRKYSGLFRLCASVCWSLLDSCEDIIMGSHKEGGASTFWSYALNLPLSSNSMISWKFCYVLHKLLRDGHRNAVADSYRRCRNVKDMGVLWGNLHDRYGHIVALSAKYLCLKMEFHAKHKVIPGNLEASDETVEREAGTDMTKVLDMTNELLDYMDAGLKMAETVLRQLDANGAKSTTPAGQCRLTPLIPLILDCSFLYHFSVRLMFKLHSRIAPDVLLGHRERFRDLFTSLTQFFDRAREMEFFKSVIQIPDLPDAPPNFLRAAALAEYKKPVVVMPGEEQHEEEEVEPQPEFRESYYLLSQMGGSEAPVEQRETETESLRRELEVLKPELQLIKNEAQRCVTELKAQVNRLEAEVEEQRTHKQVAMVENEHLRMEVEALRCTNVANVGAQIGYKEAAELRFTQLKERHAELVTSHADLMKKNAETVKMLSSTKQDQDDLLRAKKQLESELENLRQQSSNMVRPLQPLTHNCRHLLVFFKADRQRLGTQLNSTLAGLQAEREVLLRSVREQEAELNSLRQQAQLHHSSMEQERQRSSMELGSLHAQLQQQACREGELAQKLQEEQFCLLQCAVVEAEGIILDAVAKVDDPIHVRCISSPDYLVNRAEITLGSIDKMQQSHLVYLGNRNDASGLLRAVTQFSHLAADTIVNGAATSHSAPTDQADRLTDSCRDCANHCLQFLKDLKFQASLQRADPSAIRYTVQRILALGQDLRPKGQDVLKEELGSMVDKEMIATSTAIEEAVLRMDEILNQAKKDTSGVKLEVNQRYVCSCTIFYELGIRFHFISATDLQKDIVEGGRGAASVTEFYAKNSRWTEGLISASKAVGWGATQLLDSADRVVGENGTYEELIACSHEIAGSTAQLVAASKVKADRNNKKLKTLQQASRHVNDMAAVVVSSTKHGQMQISDHGVMDFSGMSLIKLKKEEMEAQVKVLQLESQLEQERVRLGELRKRHYDLGVSGTGTDAADDLPPPPPPTLLDSTPVPPSFSQTQPYLNTNPFAPAPTQPYSMPQSYTPTINTYTPSQSYIPSQPYIPTQPFTPAHLYTPNPTQSYLKPQSYSPSPSPSPQPQPPPSQPQTNTTETTKPASRKPNIFIKSGNLLKNAVRAHPSSHVHPNKWIKLSR
uniref:Huntingtin interacting protein 1 related n=1 Tax=Lates calcarifer TaxID=8187 RepID=A0A4W6DD23_LATCA